MFSPNHRQHLLVALRELDESLADVDGCLTEAAGNRLFHPYRGAVDAAVHARADALIANICSAIAGFLTAQELRSPPPTVPVQRAASARASVAMVAALELDASRVGGYGPLSTEESAALDALSAQLGERLAQLVALFDTAHPGPTGAADPG